MLAAKADRDRAADELVSEAEQVVVEAQVAVDRLKNAARLYRERATGVVEVKAKKGKAK